MNYEKKAEELLHALMTRSPSQHEIALVVSCFQSIERAHAERVIEEMKRKEAATEQFITCAAENARLREALEKSACHGCLTGSSDCICGLRAKALSRQESSQDSGSLTRRAAPPVAGIEHGVLSPEGAGENPAPKVSTSVQDTCPANGHEFSTGCGICKCGKFDRLGTSMKQCPHGRIYWESCSSCQSSEATAQVCPDCELHSDCCGQPCPKHEAKCTGEDTHG